MRLPRIAVAVSGREFLHESIDFLRLAGQSELLEEKPQRGDEVFPRKVEIVHVRIHHLLVEAAK